LELFHRLAPSDQQTAIDLVAVIAKRRHPSIEEMKEWYDALPEDDELLSEEEIFQMSDVEGGYLTREEAKARYGIRLP
jgi:hypothetical protein